MPVTLSPQSVALDLIRRRLESATDELSRPASQPRIDGSTAHSELAKSAWAAASLVWGTQYTTTSASGWVAATARATQLSARDLQNLNNQALRILDTMKRGEAVPREALERLPEAVDDYWRQTFGANHALQPAQRDAFVALIRAAALDD